MPAHMGQDSSNSWVDIFKLHSYFDVCNIYIVNTASRKCGLEKFHAALQNFICITLPLLWLMINMAVILWELVVGLSHGHLGNGIVFNVCNECIQCMQWVRNGIFTHPQTKKQNGCVQVSFFPICQLVKNL